MGGLDVFNKIASYLLPELCSSGEVSRVLSDPAANGDFGTKTGSGIFEWSEDEIEETNRKREQILVLLAKEFRKDL
jgi:3-hydroxybutyryl-CoA dehydrogenase